MGTLVVILLVTLTFFILALFVLTFREFVFLLTFLWNRWKLVVFHVLLGIAIVFGSKVYLDPMSAGAVGVLISFALIAFSYRAFRKRHIELLDKEGLGESRRISRKKLLEVYRLGGKPVDRCEQCGERGLTLDIHHIVPIAEGGNNELSNLKLLCPNCHRREHDGMRG